MSYAANTVCQPLEPDRVTKPRSGKQVVGHCVVYIRIYGQLAVASVFRLTGHGYSTRVPNMIHQEDSSFNDANKSNHIGTDCPNSPAQTTADYSSLRERFVPPPAIVTTFMGS
eukprot:4720434-Pyramimonas_sp.AAC.1